MDLVASKSNACMIEALEADNSSCLLLKISFMLIAPAMEITPKDVIDVQT